MNRVRELWATDRGRLAHYLVAGSLAVFLVIEFATLKDIVGDPVDNRWLVTALAIVAGSALFFIRDYPLAAPLVSLGAIGTTLFLMQPYVAREAESPFLVVILFIPWCLGTYNDTRKAVAGLLIVESVGAIANVQFGQGPGDFLWIGSFIAVSWTTGFVLSRRAEQAREAAERARRLEREQIESAHRAVTEERQRIARELHDVIAHSVSVMTVQAGAVRRLLTPDQVKEREAL